MKRISRPMAAVLFTLSAAGTLAPSPADASIKWLVPGDVCNYDSPADETEAGRGLSGNSARGWSYVSNNSVENKSVSCPIQRQNLYNTNGLDNLEVRLHLNQELFPGPTLALVRCQAWSQSEFTGTVLIVEKEVTLTAFQSYKMDWQRSINMSFPRGAYIVECQLPAGVQLLSVATSEYNPK